MEKFYPENFFDLSEFEFKDVFLSNKPAWETVRNLESYLKSFFQKSEKIYLNERFPRAFIEGKNVYVGENTKIFPGAFIGENVIIANNCEIRPGAFIRENVILGNDCIVGNSCEIKNAILLNHAWTSHFNYIGDSIVGSNTNIAASTIFANIRFDFFDEDAKTIQVKDGQDRYDTKLRKFGAIFGDNSQTGCKCVLNPGTFVGKKSTLGGLKGYSGYIEPGSFILERN